MTNIQKLNNPLSRRYFDVKDLFCGSMIPWTHNSSGGKDAGVECEVEGHDFMPFLSHAMLIRPEMYGYPVQASNLLPMVMDLIAEIIEYNQLGPLKAVHRVNANLVFPTEKMRPSEPHVDHQFPHKNLLMYLTDQGGNTVVGDEIYVPQEDDIITFDGSLVHYMHPPKTGGRVVIIATYETVN